MTSPWLTPRREHLSCRDKTHKAHWHVLQRHCNHSAFNGYHYTPSDYSQVRCPIDGLVWRTKGAYVGDLPDAPEGWWNLPAPGVIEPDPSPAPDTHGSGRAPASDAGATPRHPGHPEDLPARSGDADAAPGYESVGVLDHPDVRPDLTTLR